MNPLDMIFGRMNNPPARLKVFAPNGDTRVFLGWIGIRECPASLQLAELFLMEDKQDAKMEVMNKKVVVQNLETGEVIYDPRRAPTVLPGGRHLITGSEKFWLQRNPHWPGILELYDNPVKEDDENGGGVT